MNNEPTIAQIAAYAGHSHRHAAVLDQGLGAFLEIASGIIGSLPSLPGKHASQDILLAGAQKPAVDVGPTRPFNGPRSTYRPTLDS